MKLNDFDAVIFDLGGVIINLDYDLTIKEFEAMGIRNFEAIYSQLNQSALFDDFETGKLSTQQFINTLLDHLPQGTSPNKVVAAWNAMILDVPERKTKLLRELMLSKKTFLLSNTNEIHIQKVRRNWSLVTSIPIEKHFYKIFLSHEIGLRKPNEEVFQFVCKEENLDPRRTLFIDDSPQHIEGAQRAGIVAHHLTDPEDFYAFFS